MAADPYKYFRIEAAEILDGLGKGALELERGEPPAAIVSRLLRFAHTLKGAARVVRQTKIAEIAHAIEDVLVPLRERTEPGAASAGVIRSLLDLLEAMRSEVAALDAPPPPAAANAPKTENAGLAAAPAPETDALFRSVRADLEEIDALADGLAEVGVRLRAARKTLSAVDRARSLGERLTAAEAARRQASFADEAQTAGGAGALSQEIVSVLAGLKETLEAGIERAEREVSAVREGALRLRLVPASTLFASLERVARDAAQAMGKRVDFVVRGGDVRLDAHLLGNAQDALIQLVRNAVAHGLEGEAERAAAGKPPAGRIEIAVERRGNRASFACRDDGRGIDLEAVRRALRKRGTIGGDDAGIGRDELLRLLMKGGVTTSRAATEIAGRGVGLDVVREAARRIGAEVAVTTDAGRGSSFEMSAPVSIASVEALLVEVAGITVALPIEAVRCALRVVENELRRTPEGASVLYEGRAIPCVALAALLGARETSKPRQSARTAVVVEVDGTAVAFLVDRLQSAAAVVMRSLSPLAQADPIVAAASLDAFGDPRLVLDPEALLAAAARGGLPVADGPTAPRAPVLVIDDSLTTRMLEQSILESAGYEVDVASSALEGLEKAGRRHYGLFLVDVEMPGMDGLTFVRQTRSDVRFRDTPAILVTSCGAPEDKQRGLDAGAAAYVVKGDFNQAELLSIIDRLSVTR